MMQVTAIRNGPDNKQNNAVQPTHLQMILEAKTLINSWGMLSSARNCNLR
uniref:Uncharacterized protein n=1 Tax=Rhizophora mucronata TaxID=61149 RepID=A0A2P2ITD8_RHIMU